MQTILPMPRRPRQIGVMPLRVGLRRFALGGHTGFPGGMPDMNRRNAMLMAGIGALAATMPIATAGASPAGRDLPVDRVPLPTAPPGGYLFQDEFDGKAGSAPDPSKWEAATERE